MKATVAQIANSLVRHSGNVGKVADECGLTFQAVYMRIKRYPKLQDILAELDENTTTAARGVVMGAIAEGDTNLAWKWLTTRAPEFRPSASLKLDDEQLEAMISAADQTTLRKIAGGG